VRLLADKPDTWSGLPEAVVIRWNFPAEGAVENALSNVERFEDVMRPLWSSTSSCLALVITYAECREWTCYQRNVRSFVRDLNEGLASNDIPSSLEHKNDPSWSLWEQFASLLK
jgi:hypothetical protein